MSWQEVLYQKIFEDECTGLERRRENDGLFSVADVERTLKDLYVLDGADWLGRGEVGDITSAATIAAHEHFAASLSSRLT
jgi:hypothetical protein